VEYPLLRGNRASGSVFSTASDMCRWLLLHLGNGTLGERKIISQANIVQMQSIQIAEYLRPLSKVNVLLRSYGLGWTIDSYRGNYRVRHDGRTRGFESYVLLFPYDQFGVVVLANRYSFLPIIIANYISDMLLGLEPVVSLSKRLRNQSQAMPPPPEKPRTIGTKPAHPLSDYAGDYFHPAYGNLIVAATPDGLQIIFHDYSSLVEHWHYETFSGISSDLKGMFITFQNDDSGAVASASMPLEPAVKPIIFAKTPEAAKKK